jgi:hypothetical protein
MNMSQMNGGGNLSATSYTNNNTTYSAPSLLTPSSTNNIIGGQSTQFSGISTSSFQLSNLSSSSNSVNPNQEIIMGGNNYGSQQAYSATSPLSNVSMPHQFIGGAEVSTTSSLPINYSNILGGAKNKKNKKEEKDGSSSSSTPGHLDKEMDELVNEQDASSSSSSASSEGSTSQLARALASTDNSTTRRELSRVSAKSKSKDSSSTASSSNTSSTSTVSVQDSSSSHTSSSSYTPENTIRLGRNQSNYMLSSPISASSNNVVNVKQFYSSESGDLYSSNSNYLRNNIAKNRLR